MKALLFDLDGTLVDSVYAHTIAWQQALEERGLVVPAREVHQRVGLGGPLLVRSLERLAGRIPSSPREVDRLEHRHAALFRRQFARCAPLPGAKQLLKFLRSAKVPHGIATTGKRREIEPALEALGLHRSVTVVDGTAVDRAKPDADIFLECQRRLGLPASECVIVGDAIWDMHAAQRAGIFAVGLLSGGCGEQALYNAGARQVYADAAELHQSLHELAVLP